MSHICKNTERRQELPCINCDCESSASIAGLGVTPQVRARTLLSLLWRKYDAGGISMGRSYESVLLEAAMDLLGPSDEADVSRLDAMQSADLLNETRSYLSSQRARREGLAFNAK